MITVYSNVICAKNTLTSIKDEKIKDFLTANEPIFLLGAISYNLFCAFDIFSKEENTWLKSIRTNFSENKNEFFDIAKKYISKSPKDEKDMLTAYLTGAAIHRVFTHYTMPYLNYLTKDIANKKDENLIAIKLDCALATKNDEPLCFNEVLTQISPEQKCAVEKMYSYVIKQMQREIIPDEIISECIDKLNKALTQRKSIFKRIGSEFVYTKTNDFSILNETHTRWCDPQNPQENNSFSYTELVSYAQRDCIKTIPKFYALTQRALSTESCEFLFRNMK